MVTTTRINIKRKVNMPINKSNIKPFACRVTRINGTRNKSITSNLARKGLNKSKLLVTTGVLALSGISIGLLPNNTNAAYNMQFSVDATQVSLDVSVPAASALQLTPTSEGSFGTANVNVGVGTSWVYGYTLTMQTATNTTSLTGQNHGGTIATLNNNTTYTASQFESSSDTLNKWGVSWGFAGDGSHIATNYSTCNATTIATSSSCVFKPVSTSQTLTKVNTNYNRENTTLTFGAKLDNTVTADSYGITLVFAVTPNSSVATTSFNDAFYNNGKTTVNGFYALQDMTNDICSVVPLGSEGQLIDRRDNKVYWVAKLKNSRTSTQASDGKCWMTQGLDLDLSSSVALTNANTDLHSVSSWTPLNSTEDSTTKTITVQTTSNNVSSSGFTTNWNTDGNDKPHSTDPGDRYVVPTQATTTYANYWDLQDTYYNSLTACNTALASTSSFTGTDCTHYQLGNFYNFAAATATNSVSGTVGHTITDADNYYDMPDSICPANWRLPHGLLAASTNGTASTNNSEFDTILYAYNVTNLVGATVNQQLFWNNNSQTNGYTGLNNIRKSPLYFTRSGRVSNGTLYLAGVSGRSWSSTIGAIDDTSGGYSSTLDSTFVMPAHSDYRYYGFPIRCIARSE